MDAGQEGALARDFVNGPFYRLVFKKYIDEQKQEIHDKIDRLILEDAPKNTFGVYAGKRKQIKEIEDFFEALVKRT